MPHRQRFKLMLCMQVDLVVATPKRLAHLVKSKQIDLSAVEFLILDEADKLFEEGFLSHIDAVIHACSHPDIVSLFYLFSTTHCNTCSSIRHW